jgi:hypothetical protein
MKLLFCKKNSKFTPEMKVFKVMKIPLTLLLSGAILACSFSLLIVPVQEASYAHQNDASVKDLSYVDFIALPSIFEEGDHFKNFFNNSLFFGIKDQVFSWKASTDLHQNNFGHFFSIPYYYLKQILFPFHSFW